MELLQELGWYPLAPDALAKAEVSEDRTQGFIEGIGSSEHRDKDDEIIVQKGIAWEGIDGRGLIPLTLEHPDRQVNRIGKLREAPVPTMLPDGVPGHLLKGAVALTHPAVKTLWDAASALTKAGMLDIAPTLGFSVEGVYGARDPSDRRRVLSCRVKTVAVTGGPRNAMATWKPVMKGILGAVATVATGAPTVNLADVYGKDFVRLLKGLDLTDLQIAHLHRRRPSDAFSRVRAAHLLTSGGTP